MSNTYLPTDTFFDTGFGSRVIDYTEDGIEMRRVYPVVSNNGFTPEQEYNYFNDTIIRENINPIYVNQEEIGKKISDKFDIRKIVSAMLIALTQSGKTGAILAIIKHFMEKCNIEISNIFIITGLSDLDWLEQTCDAIPSILRENVYHRNKLLSEFTDKITNMKNVLIIMDEVHTAAQENQTVQNALLLVNEILTKEYMMENDIKMVDVSATPDGIYGAKQRWGDNHQTFYMEPGPNYTSCIDYLNQGRIKQYTKISLTLREFKAYEDHTKDMSNEDKKEYFNEKYGGVVKNIFDLATDIRTRYNNKRYHIVRIDGKMYEFTKELFHEYGSNFFDYTLYDKDYKDDINKMLKNAPNRHHIIFVYEKLRCAKTITKDYIGILYERYSKQKNDSTIIQSLLGRGTGYNVPQDIIIYTNIPTVEKFKLLWENRFENFDEVGWISNTTKGKKTFADPSLTGFESDISSDSDSTLSESEDDFAYRVFEENERFTNFKDFVKDYFPGWNLKRDQGRFGTIKDIKDNNSTVSDILIRRGGLNARSTKRMYQGSDKKWVVYWKKSAFPGVPSDD